MNLVNATGLVAGYTMATDKTGREWLVVVAKGTYGIPDHPEDEPVLLQEQVPLVMTDVYAADPASSAPLYEIDFALCKPRCDVLLNGSCHAPQGRPATTVPVGLRVASMVKSFNVVGDRIWVPGFPGAAPGAPEPFVVMPLSYDNAYGGVHKPEKDPATHRWFLPNHVGVGYCPGDALGRPLPNTEAIGQPVHHADGDYVPMAFGPLGRAWQQRIRWAGTYDQAWLDETFPFLPADFDDRYFQSAAQDQQTDYLRGGEEVVMLNLTPQGRTAFRLPALKAPLAVQYKNGDEKRISGVVDTLLLEPDLGRFTLTLRASFALRRNLHEVAAIEVGRVLPQPLPRDGEEEQVLPKPHYRSLAELVSATRAERAERWERAGREEPEEQEDLEEPKEWR
jgi:hypothetical protein